MSHSHMSRRFTDITLVIGCFENEHGTSTSFGVPRTIVELQNGFPSKWDIGS